MDPVILASARKHGVTDNDMLHAYRSPIKVFGLDDPVMLIDPDMNVVNSNKPNVETGQKCFNAYFNLDAPCPDCKMAKVLRSDRSSRTSG